MFIHGTFQSWNKPNKEESDTVVDTTFNLEQLFLPIPATEFELPFKICISCLRYG